MSEPTDLLDESPEVEALGGFVCLDDVEAAGRSVALAPDDALSAEPEVVEILNAALVEGVRAAWNECAHAQRAAKKAADDFERAWGRAQVVLGAALDAQGRTPGEGEHYAVMANEAGGLAIRVVLESDFAD